MQTAYRENVTYARIRIRVVGLVGNGVSVARDHAVSDGARVFAHEIYEIVAQTEPRAFDKTRFAALGKQHVGRIRIRIVTHVCAHDGSVYRHSADRLARRGDGGKGDAIPAGQKGH